MIALVYISLAANILASIYIVYGLIQYFTANKRKKG